MLRENEVELSNALPYRYLLSVDEKEVRDFLALKKDDEDWWGELAQKLFHIVFVKFDNSYCHILHLDESRSDENSESDCNKSLVKGVKLIKLPACQSCYTRLRMAHKLLYKSDKVSLNHISGTSSPSDTDLQKAIEILP